MRLSRPVDVASARRLDEHVLHAWPLPVHDGGDKYDRGTALVIGGSPTTPGAARLAGEAALRMGAGRLQLVTAASVAVTLAVAVPEAMVRPLETTAAGGLCWEGGGSLGEQLRAADCVLLGPGLLDQVATRRLVEAVLTSVGDATVVVLDALALATLPLVPGDLVPRGRLVLTPNRQELHALLADGETHDAAAAVEVAGQYGAVVTCFGRITTPHAVWDTEVGPPGLGTSGSGDVLAGLVAGAAARGGDPAQAACWATYAHTNAAAGLSAEIGEMSFLASELVAAVPRTLAPFNGDGTA